MAFHGIEIVARLTAVSAFRIRAWETRYGVVKPRRDGRGHRLYTNQDLWRLMLLAKATRQVHRIGEIARLPNARLKRLGSAGGSAGESRVTRLRSDVLAALERYDVDTVCATLGDAIASLPPLDAVQAVFSPLLHEVGERWHAGTMTIAQEHLLSTSVERVIGGALQNHRTRTRGAPFICGTLSGELHGFGSLLVAYLASVIGYSVYLVGTNLPPEEFRRTIHGSSAVLAAVSVVTAESASRLPGQLDALCMGLRKDARIVVGGRAATALKKATIPAQCRILHSAGDLLELLLDSA